MSMKHDNVKELSPDAYERAKRDITRDEPQSAGKAGAKHARDMTAEQYKAARKAILK